MPLEKNNISITFSTTEKMAEELDDAADEFKVTRSDIIRACIQNDLPKLRERERKRKKSRKERDSPNNSL